MRSTSYTHTPGLRFRQSLLAADVGVRVNVESFVALVQGSHARRARVEALLRLRLPLVELVLARCWQGVGKASRC